MYCSNCGAEIGDEQRTCSYCGNYDEPDEVLLQKDTIIQELEQKINTLEGKINKTNKTENDNKMFIWMFLFAFAFFISFLVIFAIIVIFR
jgi:hypothetical protein